MELPADVLHVLSHISSSIRLQPPAVMHNPLPATSLHPASAAVPLPCLQIKQTLIRKFGFHDNVPCHLAASLCAGFLAVVAGSPFDVVKSRAMGEWYCNGTFMG